MGMNCFVCKWHRLKTADAKSRKAAHVTDAEISAQCDACYAAFCESLTKRLRTCFACEWKDRNLPYEARQIRCKACAAAFAKVSGHDCAACPWNDPKRRMPSDATMAHCKACLAITDGYAAKNCDACRFREMPEAVRRPHCLKCSLKFAANRNVSHSTNELSNKGQTIISYDNHNANMTDDRDTVTQIRRDYAEKMRSESGPSYQHPVFKLVFTEGMTAEERIAQAQTFAENAYESMKRFLYEFGQLTDMQALLFLSEVKGETKTDFAKNHNLTNSAVNGLFKQILALSPVFKDYILLTRGTIQGTRGRKSKDGKSMERVPKKHRKSVFVGSFQQELFG